MADCLLQRGVATIQNALRKLKVAGESVRVPFVSSSTSNHEICVSIRKRRMKWQEGLQQKRRRDRL
jgi:hypothetical protein